jgi:hypothetical protein
MHRRGSPATPSERRMLPRSIALAFVILVFAFPSNAASPNAALHRHPGTAYVTPKGAGHRDGSSWMNAGTLSAFGALLARAGPGGRILLRADTGAYETPTSIDVRGGGTPDRPITVMGVDASENPMKAVIVGTRATPYSPEGSPGSEVFRLREHRRRFLEICKRRWADHPRCRGERILEGSRSLTIRYAQCSV